MEFVMKHSLIALAVALATCTAAVTAHAQKAPAKKPAATKKAPVKKAAAKKAPAKKTTAKRKTTTKTAAAKPAPQVAAAPAPVMVPDAAGGFPVYTGSFSCDGGTATIAAQGDGFNVRIPGGRQYAMRRVPTSSGVVRLETANGAAYWLQSGNKSMMIDTKAGGRVADGCRNAIQQAREDDLKVNPVSLL